MPARGPHYIQEELQVLVQQIAVRANWLFCEDNSKVSNEQKHKGWTEIQQKLTAARCKHKDADKLQRKFEKMKNEFEIRMKVVEILRMGGHPGPFRVEPFDAQIKTILEAIAKSNQGIGGKGKPFFYQSVPILYPGKQLMNQSTMCLSPGIK